MSGDLSGAMKKYPKIALDVSGARKGAWSQN